MALDETVRRVATVLVVLCLAAFVGAVGLVVSPSLRQGLGLGPAPAPSPYEKGGVIDVPSSMYDGPPLTLILFGRSTCAACQAGVPAYQAAILAASARSIPTWLVTPLPDLTSERPFAEALGIDMARVTHIPPEQLRLQSVPALVLVDRRGTVQGVWMSAPDATRQADIIRAIQRAGGAGS